VLCVPSARHLFGTASLASSALSASAELLVIFVTKITLTVVLTNRKRKKRSEETQTLRAGCSKAEPKKNSPRRRPPSRGRRTAKI